MRAVCFFFVLTLFSFAFAPAAVAQLPRDIKLGDDLRFGPEGCPVFAINTEIWDARTGRPTGVSFTKKMTIKPDYAFSPDGKLLVIGTGVANTANTGYEIWSTETGKVLAQIEPAKDIRSFVQFAGNDRIVVAGQNARYIEVFETQTGKLSQRTALEDSLQLSSFAVSPAAPVLAMKAKEQIKLYDLANGKLLATMAPAVVQYPATGKAGEKLKGKFVEQKVDMIDCSLAFSPDGQQIAAMQTFGDTTLFTWDLKGKLTWSMVLVDQWAGESPYQRGLSWLPDGSGFIVAGQTLVDRKTKSVLVRIKSRELRPRREPFKFFSNDGLLIVRDLGEGRHQLDTLKVPWDGIRKSMDAMAAKGPAYIRPGQKVAMELDLKSLPGDQEGAKTQLQPALVYRLERDGLSIDGKADVIVGFKIDQSAGEVLRVREFTPFSRDIKDTGQNIQASKGGMVMTVFTAATSETLWRSSVTGESSRFFEGKIDDQAIRKSMLTQLIRELQAAPLPYFLPKDPQLLALPVEIVLE